MTAESIAYHPVRSCIIILCGCLGLCVASCVILYFILTFGQISGFRPIVTGDIPDTDYRFTLISGWLDQVYLENKSSQTKTELGEVMIRPEYTVLVHQDKRYLIVRAGGGGTDGRVDYAIWNITDVKPIFVGGESSCDPPKLIGDELQFNFHGKCRSFEIDSYDRKMKLK